MLTSFTISTKFGSIFDVDLFEDKLLTINFRTEIASGYALPDGTPARQLHQCGRIQINGTRDDLRLFARRVMEAVDPRVDVEPPVERNAAVAEPLRSVLNSISPEVPDVR